MADLPTIFVSILLVCNQDNACQAVMSPLVYSDEKQCHNAQPIMALELQKRNPNLYVKGGYCAQYSANMSL